jgi:hypothetical protein
VSQHPSDCTCLRHRLPHKPTSTQHSSVKPHRNRCGLRPPEPFDSRLPYKLQSHPTCCRHCAPHIMEYMHCTPCRCPARPKLAGFKSSNRQSSSMQQHPGHHLAGSKALLWQALQECVTSTAAVTHCAMHPAAAAAVMPLRLQAAP